MRITVPVLDVGHTDLAGFEFHPLPPGRYRGYSVYAFGDLLCLFVRITVSPPPPLTPQFLPYRTYGPHPYCLV